MLFLRKSVSWALVAFCLMTASGYVRAQAVVILAISPVLVASLNANESMEIIISDLGPPPDQAENADPALNGWTFKVYDSDGNQLVEVPAQTLQRKGFVYLKLAASECEIGMASCTLTITDGTGGAQRLNIKPLGDRVVVRPKPECKGKCDRRILVQQNLLGPDGSTVDVRGHVDHGKTTLTAAITRID